MIQQGDLRIGNYFSFTRYKIARPLKVRDIRLFLGGERLFETIPLTEEWLLKFGFTQYKESRFYVDILVHGRIYFNISSESIICELSNNYGTSYGYIKCHYVHQLQNLYFALTEKELILNSENLV